MQLYGQSIHAGITAFVFTVGTSRSMRILGKGYLNSKKVLVVSAQIPSYLEVRLVTAENHRWVVIVGSGCSRHGFGRVGTWPPAPSEIASFQIMNSVPIIFSQLVLQLFREQSESTELPKSRHGDYVREHGILMKVIRFGSLQLNQSQSHKLH